MNVYEFIHEYIYIHVYVRKKKTHMYTKVRQNTRK